MMRLRDAHPDMVVTCEATNRHPGSLHIRFPGVDATDLLSRLQPQLAAATGSACTSGIIGPSHVLLALGFSPVAAAEGLRLSLGRFTGEAEIERAATAISWAVSRAASQVA
jgi:cysteine desulfurase